MSSHFSNSMRLGFAVAFWFAISVSATLGQVKLTNSAFAAPSDKDQPDRTVPGTVAKLPDVSKEAFVFDEYRTQIRIETDGTGTRQSIARIRVQSDAGVKQLAILPFTYSTANQQVEINYVRVRKPGGTVIETPEYNVQDMPAAVSRDAPMYSDVHQKQVTVRGLGVGDTLEYQVTLRILKPEVSGQFWLEYAFEKNVIVLDEELELDLPAEMSAKVVSSDARPTVSDAPGRRIYHWASSNLKHQDFDTLQEKHWKPSVQVTTFTDWDQVGAWYRSLQRNSLVITPAIKAHADAVTRGLTTNNEKIRAIADDVALHIHYVGLNFGIGRYQPHVADDVLANEYGDCKDKHTLLAAMLKAVGIEAWPVLISSKRELDPAVPSPAQFDHVITLVPEGKSFIWIDTTAEIAPVGALMPNLRDKQALAIPDSSPAFLERTPAQSSFPSSVRINVDAQLSDHGLLKGHITQTTSGDADLLFRLAFRRSPQSRWNDIVQIIASTEGYGGKTSDANVSDVEQIESPLVISFDYTREKYFLWDDSHVKHWIAPPLPLMGGELAPGAAEKKPDDDPKLGSIGKTVYHADLRLPPGWTLTPPKDVEIDEDWLRYTATYSFKDGVLTAERTLFVKKQKVPLVQWSRYVAFRRGMYEDLNHEVLIYPGPNAQTASVSNLGSTDNAQGTVNLDSLSVYSGPTKDSDVILTLTRGTVVRVGMSVTSGDGVFCSIFNADTSAKIGFVLCNGLNRTSVPDTAASGSVVNFSVPDDQPAAGAPTSCNALQYFSAKGQISEVEAILESKPDLVSCRMVRGFTPLHTAAARGQVEVAQFLITHGAKINVRADAGDTPLYWAARDNMISTVKFLLAEGAAINLSDKDGNTPLHWAAAHGNVEMTELLIAHGAAINLRNNLGCTPLRGAIDNHQSATARVLAGHGGRQ